MSDLCSAIKEQVDVLDYLKEIGYHPIKAGTHYWKLAEHDSFVYDERKKAVYWNSHGLQGSIIDLYMELNGCDRNTAITNLRNRMWSPEYQLRAVNKPQPSPAEEKKLFILPEESKAHWRRIYAYLLKERALEANVVSWLAEQRVIYPDERGNLVYISRNEDGVPDYAAKKGATTGNHYRSVVEGGNYNERFRLNLTPSTQKLVVTEAFIDAASFASMLEIHGLDYKSYGYLSLESCYEAPLKPMLEKHPSIKIIYLAQDNDSGGNASRTKCRELLQRIKYQGRIIDKVPLQKDWNDELKFFKASRLQEQSKTQALAPTR